jgi:hypothetical protein
MSLVPLNPCPITTHGTGRVVSAGQYRSAAHLRPPESKNSAFGFIMPSFLLYNQYRLIGGQEEKEATTM